MSERKQFNHKLNKVRDRFRGHETIEKKDFTVGDELIENVIERDGGFSNRTGKKLVERFQKSVMALNIAEFIRNDTNSV